MYGDNAGLMGVGMWLFWIIFPFVIIVLLKILASMGRSSKPEKSPIDILKDRYASGEIDDAEFQHRRQELEK